MQFTSAEVKAIEMAVGEDVEKEMPDLNEFQLALVGGGIADPVFA